MSDIDIYLEFLRFCLHEDAEEPASLKDMNWEGLMDFAIKQSIQGVIYHGLERLEHSPNRPDKYTILAWYSLYGEIRQGNKQAYLDSARLQRILYKENGIKSCILKGQANAIMYPDPFMRCSGDIDLWTDATIQNIIKWVHEKYPNGEIGYHHIEFNVLKTPAEIHFFPSFMGNIFYEYRLRKYFDQHKEEQFVKFVKIPEEQLSICVASDSFNRVFQMSHIMHHFFFEGIGLRQLIDYYYLLRRGFTEDEKEETIQAFKYVNMYKFSSAVMYIMKEVLCIDEKYILMKPNKKLGRQLLDEILQSGNFGHHDKRYSFQGKSIAGQYIMETYRNLHFAFEYPSETIWGRPISRWWHMIYKWHLRRYLRRI